MFFQITFGSEIPRTYYVRDSIKVDYDQCVTIGRGSSHQVEYELLAPNCALRWAENTLDMRYGVCLEPDHDIKDAVNRDITEIGEALHTFLALYILFIDYQVKIS